MDARAAPPVTARETPVLRGREREEHKRHDRVGCATFGGDEGSAEEGEEPQAGDDCRGGRPGAGESESAVDQRDHGTRDGHRAHPVEAATDTAGTLREHMTGHRDSGDGDGHGHEEHRGPPEGADEDTAGRHSRGPSES